MNNKISIIIPAYNTADVISRTIQSVENQTYKNYEIVIINDGSTDETKTFLDNYKKNKSNVIVYHQDNKGVSTARNKGLEICTGDYVCFLDSDDTYEPTFLEEMLNIILKSKCDAAYCYFNQIKMDKIINIYPPTSSSHLQSFLMNGEKFSIWHSCFLLRKSSLINHNVQYNIKHTIGEDILFIVTILTRLNVKCVKKNLFNYIYRENSTMNIDSKFVIDRDFKDVTSYIEMKKEILNTYKGKDKENVITSITKHLNMKILYASKYLFISFHYKYLNELKSHINYVILNNEKLDNKLKRVMFFLKSKFHYILGSIYYRWIRK